MCGIAGWLSPAGAVDPSILTAMNQKIAHRGPDADAVWLNETRTVGFTHRRLAIIDLQSTSNQPLHDATGHFSLVFNGEIYNYQTLRAELQQLGAVFRTDGDSEVILEAYKTWGFDCLQRLRGMFAFALWDARQRLLFMARDRFGKKPFFYRQLPDSAGGGIIFASEPRALAAYSDASQPLNEAALGKYLTLGYSIGEDTLWQDVKRLPAAHAMVFPLQGVARQFEYWDLAAIYQHKSTTPASEAAAQLRHEVDKATQLRLQSDVPFGLFLSGGLDSNTVLASMAAALGGENVRTFSIAFDDKKYDESGIAAASAQHFKTQHTTINVNPDTIDIEKIIAKAGEEPLADVSFIPTYVLAKETAKRVKMVLTGDGGDELFAGYPTYIANALHRSISRLLPNAGWAALANAVPTATERRSTAYKVKQLLHGFSLSACQAHVSWRIPHNDGGLNLLNPEITRHANAEAIYAAFEPHFERVKSLHPLDQALYVDAKTWLVDSVLVKVDRATMAHGLEARSPLLDQYVAEFAARLPVDQKLRLTTRGYKTKWLLRQSQQQIVPDFIHQQPKKGFSTPLAQWFGGQMLDFVQDTANSNALTAMINKKAVTAMVSAHAAGQADYSLPLFNVLVLARFCR